MDISHSHAAPLPTPGDSAVPVAWNQADATSLKTNPTPLDFFQAIRRLEALARTLPRVGHAVQADQEGVRISQSIELGFAPRTIDRIEERADGKAELQQRFFGLLGPGGPMPLEMTERIREASRHLDDPTSEAFLNLFNHRMATLLYRAWSSSRGAIQRDRPDEDRFANYLSDLAGGPAKDASKTEDPVETTTDQIQRYFAGRFANAHRHAEGLQAILSSVIDAPVVVESFLLRGLPLDPEDYTVLTAGENTSNNPAVLAVRSSPRRDRQLGRNTVLGRRIPDRATAIGLRIGPLRFEMFQHLTPDGKLYPLLVQIIRRYVDPGLEVRVRLVLQRESVAAVSLGKQGQLGRTGWIGGERTEDADDCQYMI